MKGKDTGRQVRTLHHLIESVCGIYSRVARRLRISPSFVSRVARGERKSEIVEQALIQEFTRVADVASAEASGN
jgi:hypothetical protein